MVKGYQEGFSSGGEIRTSRTELIAMTPFWKKGFTMAAVIEFFGAFRKAWASSLMCCPQAERESEKRRARRAGQRSAMG